MSVIANIYFQGSDISFGDQLLYYCRRKRYEKYQHSKKHELYNAHMHTYMHALHTHAYIYMYIFSYIRVYIHDIYIGIHT